jgi:hypothetical protein
MVVDKWRTLPLSLYPYEEDYGDYYGNIFNFINKTLGFDDSETINQIFNYFIWNYNDEGDYSNTETPNIKYTNLLNMFDDRGLILADYLKIPPFLIEKMDYPNYEMPIFFSYSDDNHYSIANEREVEDSKRTYSEDRWSEESEVWEHLGGNTYLDFVYVSDTDKRMVANEEASHYEGEMDEEDVIDYLRENMGEYENAKGIIEAYDEVAEKWGELPASANGAPYQMKMSDIAEEGRETVRLIIYDYVYDRLDNELTYYLLELGYINKREKNNDYVINKMPDWVTFDWSEFHNYDVDHITPEDLSSYGDFDTFRGNDNIYYYIMLQDY